MEENKKQINWVYTFIFAGITAGIVIIIMQVAKSYEPFLQDIRFFGPIAGFLIGGIMVASFKLKVWLESKNKKHTEPSHAGEGLRPPPDA